jgi:integrase
MAGGHVRKRLRPNGTVQGWQARYSNPDDPTRRIMATKRTRREAEEWLAEQRLAVRDGTHVDPRRADRPFSELVEAWRDARQAHLTAKTSERYDSIIRKYLLPTFGHQPTGAITKEAVTRYFGDLTRSGVSPGTVRKVHVVMSSIFSAAVRQEIVRRNPCRDLEHSLPTPPRRDMLVLTAAEVHALANFMPKRQDRLVIFLAAYTGIRADELWALTRADYDPLRAQLHVRRAIKSHNPLVVGTPKNGNGRKVGLPASVAKMLDAHTQSPPPGGTGSTALLFPGPGGGSGRKAGEGTYMRHGLWMRRCFKPAVAAVLPQKQQLRFHDLRHTSAALLIATGAHPKVIQTRLGHSSIKTTLDVYGHLLPGLDESATAALDVTLAAAAQVEPTNVSPLRAAQ